MKKKKQVKNKSFPSTNTNRIQLELVVVSCPVVASLDVLSLCWCGLVFVKPQNHIASSFSNLVYSDVSDVWEHARRTNEPNVPISALSSSNVYKLRLTYNAEIGTFGGRHHRDLICILSFKLPFQCPKMSIITIDLRFFFFFVYHHLSVAVVCTVHLKLNRFLFVCFDFVL